MCIRDSLYIEQLRINLMIRRPPRSTPKPSSAASDVYKRQVSLDHHLKHKFILCIEGNDVASNLKWVMSSNSVAVMPKPKFESWFMENMLIPDYHYIQIKDDYSDLEEKLKFYIKNTEKLQQISINANNYVNQFRDYNDEKLISLLVMEKFFCLTNQKKSLIDF